MAMCFKAKFGTPNRKVLALALADHADDDGTGIFPSVARLAKKSEISRRTVQRMLRDFEESGLLVVVSEGGAKRGDTREWRFDLEKLAALAVVKGDTATPIQKGRQKAKLRASPKTNMGVRAVTPEPSFNHQEPSKEASGQRASAVEPEIGELNGATTAIVHGVGRWLNNLSPDLPTARRIVASNVALYGADAVRRGFADMQADVIDGKIVGSPLKAFTGYCDKAKTGRTIEKPKARDWHAERKASRERLIAEAKELGRKRAAAQEAAR